MSTSITFINFFSRCDKDKLANLLFLSGIGVCMIWSGRSDFGLGLIGGAVGVSITRFTKQKRIKELQAQGLNPYDERIYAIGYRASYLTLRIVLILAAFIVLVL